MTMIERWLRVARCSGSVVLALLMTACSQIDVEVHPAADFAPARYSALGWASPPLDERSAKELRALEQSVRKSVEKGVIARGYSLAPSGTKPDLLIDYRWSRRVEPRGAGAVSPQDEAARIHDLDTTPAGDSALYRHPVADVAEKVTLRVSLRDAATRELVWWGTAATIAPREGDSEARELVDRLVEHVLRQLPQHAP